MNPREELEARLTALLLGELSADEASALREQIAQDAELARLHDRLRQAIALVRETVAAPEHETAALADAPRLSGERREKLLASFKVVPAKKLRRLRWAGLKWTKARWREYAALAAMVVGLLAVGAVLMVPRLESLRMMAEVDESDREGFVSLFGGEKRPQKLTTLGGTGHGAITTDGEVALARIETLNASTAATPLYGLAPGQTPPVVNNKIQISGQVAPVLEAGRFGNMEAYLRERQESLSRLQLPAGGKPPARPAIAPFLSVAAPPPPPAEPAASADSKKSGASRDRHLAGIALPARGDQLADEIGAMRGRDAPANPSDFFSAVADPASAPQRPISERTPTEPGSAEFASVSVAATGVTRAGGAIGGMGGGGGVRRFYRITGEGVGGGWSAPTAPQDAGIAVGGEFTDLNRNGQYTFSLSQDDVGGLRFLHAPATPAPTPSPAPANPTPAIGENIPIDATFSVPETIARPTEAKLAVRYRATDMLGAEVRFENKSINEDAITLKRTNGGTGGVAVDFTNARAGDRDTVGKGVEVIRRRVDSLGADEPGSWFVNEGKIGQPALLPAPTPAPASPPPPPVAIEAKLRDIGEPVPVKGANYAWGAVITNSFVAVDDFSTAGKDFDSASRNDWIGVAMPDRGLNISGATPKGNTLRFGPGDIGLGDGSAQQITGSGLQKQFTSQFVSGSPGFTLSPEAKTAVAFGVNPSGDVGGPAAGGLSYAWRLNGDVNRAAAGAVEGEKKGNAPASPAVAGVGGVQSVNAVGFVNTGALVNDPASRVTVGASERLLEVEKRWSTAGVVGPATFADSINRSKAGKDEAEKLVDDSKAKLPAVTAGTPVLFDMDGDNSVSDPQGASRQPQAQAGKADGFNLDVVTLSSDKSPESLERGQHIAGVETIRRRAGIALPAGERGEALEKQRVAVGPVVISEVMYNDPATGLPAQQNEFVELQSQQAGGVPVPNSVASTNIVHTTKAREAKWKELGTIRLDNASYDNLPLKSVLESQRKESEKLAKLEQDLKQSFAIRDRLQQRVWQEKVDYAMPKSAIVEIIDKADPQSAEKVNLWERISGAFSRGTERTARAAVEQESTGKSGASRTQAQINPPGLVKFAEADVANILDVYQELSGKTVFKSPSLPQARVTMENTESLTREETKQVLDTVLSMNGVSMVPQGTKFMKAVSQATAGTEGAQFNGDSAGYWAVGSNAVTHVVRLSNALPNDVMSVVQRFASLPAGVVAIPGSSLLVLRDKPENVKQMKEMIGKVDVVPQQEFDSVVIPIKSGQPSDVAKAIADWSARNGTDAKVIPDERINALLVFANKKDLPGISNVINRFDPPAPKLAAGAPVPQPEVSTAENAFSTFSLNVSDVSFKLAAASLEKGQMPDPATVRSEEFINAFDYHDPEPKGSAPIAFAWERARYPFAHDRDLLRFSVKTAASGRQPGRPLNLVLLLDNSGSMERADRVRVREACLRVLAGQLRPEDRVSVVAFARTARLWVDGLPGSQAGELPQRVGSLAPDGGTNLEDAMNVAYQTALKHFLPNGVNRVVLLTDGAANLGDVEPESLKKKVEAHRKQGVALDCFGIGWDGLNDELLEVLSRNGDGRYGFVNTPEAATSEFAGQLAGALKVAASDVKVQVEWNPRRVTAYRQIGYAKHQLKKEQFRDNTVDAAEIGAAEAGNALYTVQVDPRGEGPLGTVRVRFKVPGTSDYREHEWPLAYDGSAKSLDQSSPALRLAASASAFSEWLVSSPFAAEVTPDKLLGYLRGVPETCPADPRPKKLEWMIRQAKGVAGK